MSPTDSITQLTDAFVQFANPGTLAPIVLIKPPIIFSKRSYSTPIALPIGLAYIAAVLEKAGYNVDIIDCPGSDIHNSRFTPGGNFQVLGLNEEESIRRINPAVDIIGITIMFSQEWPFIRGYIQKIRKAFPQATIVAGGEHVTAMPEFTLKDCPEIDYLIMGEGELTFLELAFRLRAGQRVDGLRAVAMRQDGRVVITSGLARIADIKKMPWPAWHLIDLEPYFQPNYTMGISHGRNMAMLATRGCPYQCTFCSNVQMWTTRYTMRDVKDVVDEMEHYVLKYKVSSIDFYDLTAVVKREWILDLINELKVRKFKTVWQLPSGTRSEALDEKVLKGLKETGCEFVVYAPESGSQRTLDRIKKRVNLIKLQDSVRAALRLGLVVKINFIIGFPFESRLDIFRTLGLCWKMALLKAQDCNISPFSPYPGSALFDSLCQEGQIKRVDDDYFQGLMTQFDLTISKSFCRQVGDVELMVYRTVGMLFFYVLGYLRCPGRLVRLAGIFLTQKRFEANNLFEQRMYDLKARWGWHQKEPL